MQIPRVELRVCFLARSVEDSHTNVRCRERAEAGRATLAAVACLGLIAIVERRRNCARASPSARRMLWSLVQRRRLRGPGQAARYLCHVNTRPDVDAFSPRWVAGAAGVFGGTVCVHGDIPTHDMTSGRMPTDVGCQTATAICSPWRQGQRIDAAGQLPARAASPVASAGARACWGAGEWAGAAETC
jgi:hypothetical protein